MRITPGKQIGSLSTPQWMGLFIMAVGAATALCVTGMLVFGHGHWTVNLLAGILWIYGFLAIVVFFGWRMTRLGLFDTPDALHMEFTGSTWVVPWSDIVAVDVRPVYREDVLTGHDAICLRLANGKVIETPVRRRSDAWRVATATRTTGAIYSAEEFDRILALLRDRIGAVQYGA